MAAFFLQMHFNRWHMHKIIGIKFIFSNKVSIDN
jgi:hypothetical protein